MKFKCEPIKPTPVILKVNNIRTVQINPQDATATPNDVEEGKIFYGKEGREVGTYKKKILTRIVIEPTKEIQNILPESPYDGFNEVQIEKIPDEYIIPEGILKIEENGVKNVTNYSEVEVEVYDDLNSELTEQETLLNELETQVNKLPDKPVDRLQWKCDNAKSLSYEFYNLWDQVIYTDDMVTQIMSGINTSNVVNMYNMFGSTGTARYNDLSGITLDMSNCEVLNSMFSNQSTLSKLPKMINMNKPKSVENMFMNCKSLVDLSELNIGQLRIATHMFSGCSNLTKIPELNVSSTINMSYMFNGCKSLTNLDLSNWDTSSVTNMNYMFSECRKLENLDVSSFDTSKVISMNSMFMYCDSLTNLDVSSFDTSSVTNMGSMFRACSGITTISNFDTSKLTYLTYMFYLCNSITTITNFDLRQVNDLSMFIAETPNITNLGLKNIRKNLQIGRGTTWGHLLTDESIINTFQELWDNTNNALSGTRTLTLSTPSYARAEAIYVKLIDITDEMRAEDEYIDNKKPCVVCESTDEGAMTLKEYGISKNWNISK